MGERFYELREQLETLIKARIKGKNPNAMKQIKAIEREINQIKLSKFNIYSDMGPIYCHQCKGFYKYKKGYGSKADYEVCLDHDGLLFLGTDLNRLVAA